MGLGVGEAAGDLDLFVEYVAREAHDLHPVEQGAGDGRGVVGRAEEEHLGEAMGTLVCGV